MSTLSEKLKAEIEAVASDLDLAPSTVGERAGQGGKFYDRLKDGARVWPETFDKVMQRLQEMRTSSACDSSHGNEDSGVQGDAA